MDFELTSTAFAHNQPIPRKYTCDDENISPPLAWGEPPAGTKSFALIMDDPDAPAGIWVHWVIFNIPASVRSLGEGIPTDTSLSDGSRQGNNSANRCGYRGPCPPEGTHRYFFKLYALDRTLDLPEGTDKKMLLDAMRGHTLGEATLMGTYRR
jgi:Raf kinase inhibitor-like YbhB/YbcL family protein